MNFDTLLAEIEGLLGAAQNFEENIAPVAASVYPPLGPALGLATAATGALKTTLGAVTAAAKFVPPTPAHPPQTPVKVEAAEPVAVTAVPTGEAAPEVKAEEPTEK